MPLRQIARWAWLPTLLVGGWAQAHAPLSPPLGLPAEEGGMLTVATFSLAPDRAQWATRRHGIVEALRALKPDVVALQDVEQSPELPNQACWLAAQLDYACSFVSADPPSRPRRQGNALLSRRPVIADAVTLLHPFQMANTAGMIRLDLDGLPVNIYVTRLHEGQQRSGDDALIRAQQVRNLQRWIDVTDDSLPAVLLGDFAADAGAGELQGLRQTYLDARGGIARESAGLLSLPREGDGEAAAVAGRGHAHILLRKDCFRLTRVAALRLPGDEGARPRGLIATVQLLRTARAP